MTTWEYSARTVDGDVERNTVERPTREDVVDYLRRRRLIPIHIRERPEGIDVRIGPPVGTRELVVFTRQLATMVDAGVPLVSALGVLARQTGNEVLRDAARAVVRDVESGCTLADALGEHPSVFSDLYVSMVAAGEAGGILDTLLRRLATFLEKREALHRKVKGAMIYPLVIVVASMAAIAVLLLFVVPTFQVMFASLDSELPLPTRGVIGLSEFLQSYASWILLASIAASVALARWSRSDAGRLARDRALLRLPLVGDLARKAAISRVTRTLGTLLASGVSILEGLAITARTAGNRVLHDAVLASRASIAEGRSIAGPLRETGVFPPMVTQMIHVGERTGRLDEMLERVADFYDDEVDVAVDSLLSALEPAMIVVLGVVVGGMIVAMYLPIFGIIDTVP